LLKNPHRLSSSGPIKFLFFKYIKIIFLMLIYLKRFKKHKKKLLKKKFPLSLIFVECNASICLLLPFNTWTLKNKQHKIQKNFSSPITHWMNRQHLWDFKWINDFVGSIIIFFLLIHHIDPTNDMSIPELVPNWFGLLWHRTLINLYQNWIADLWFYRQIEFSYKLMPIIDVLLTRHNLGYNFIEICLYVYLYKSI